MFQDNQQTFPNIKNVTEATKVDSTLSVSKSKSLCGWSQRQQQQRLTLINHL